MVSLRKIIEMINKNRPLSLGILGGVLFLIILLLGLSGGQGVAGREFTVVLDPGHGGVGKPNDDKWDLVRGKYIQAYAAGTRHRKVSEAAVALALAKRVRTYLELTTTDEGWQKFEALLREFSPLEKFTRISFKTVMTREDGWQSRGLPSSHPDVNAPYRLYDYPDPERPGRMKPGRISMINAHKPSLILSLHLNPAYGGHKGGMAAVLTPGYRTFNLIRNISLGKRPVSRFNKLPWRETWLMWEPGWRQYEGARSDTWIYFHGYWAYRNKPGTWLKRYRGYRYNMVSWPYADKTGWEKEARKHKAGGPYSRRHEDFRPTGPFWDRERGKAEDWRREGGPAGYGGDNHYASDELLRYVQYGVRKFRPARRKPGGIGRILKPYVSTYSLPTFTNAICAYLEIGFLNRARDRSLLTNDRDAVARSLAVGVYSLFAGLKLRSGTEYGPYRPRARPIDFARYENLSGGNYFEAAAD